MQHVAQLIRQRRKELGLTQEALAAHIHVSAKAVSKWERAAGLPDASIVPALSQALGVSAESLLCGRVHPNPPDGGNMKRIKFFQCPECGNILTATGKVLSHSAELFLTSVKTLLGGSYREGYLTAK